MGLWREFWLMLADLILDAPWQELAIAGEEWGVVDTRHRHGLEPPVTAEP